MAKKVLSIDIDVFFKDCHKYQKYLNTDISAEKSWQLIEVHTETKDYEPDYKALAWLSDYLAKTLKKNTSVVQIERHNEIIAVLEEYECDNAFMTNIDDHHDITYGNEDAELNIENWVKFARKQELIRSYNWIHSDMSQICVYSPFIYAHNSWKDVSIDDVTQEYDLVVICKSPYFTPPSMWGLVDIIEQKIIKIKEETQWEER